MVEERAGYFSLFAAAELSPVLCSLNKGVEASEKHSSQTPAQAKGKPRRTYMELEALDAGTTQSSGDGGAGGEPERELVAWANEENPFKT